MSDGDTRPHMTSFTNIDCRTSTDNKDIAKAHEFTGHMQH